MSSSKEESPYSKIPVNDFSTHEVYVVSPNDVLSFARKIMLKNNISRLVVLENDNIVGILSLRDIALILTKLGSEHPPNLGLITVKKAMKSKVHILEKNASVKDACTIMYRENIGSIILVDEGKLNGIFSKTDACKVFREYPLESIRVKEAMHTNYAKVNMLSSFYKIAEKFIEGYDIVVVEDNNLPVGVITLSKIASMDENDILSIKSSLLRGSEEYSKIKVGYVAPRLMYKIDIAVNYNDKLFKAVNFMLDYNLPAIPVIDETGELIGIVSKKDVVRIISES